jgi:hypothetical protein
MLMQFDYETVYSWTLEVFITAIEKSSTLL